MTGTGQAKCCGHTHVPQAFDQGCLSLSGLTINQVAMLAEIVKYIWEDIILIYNILDYRILRKD